MICIILSRIASPCHHSISQHHHSIRKEACCFAAMPPAHRMHNIDFNWTLIDQRLSNWLDLYKWSTAPSSPLAFSHNNNDMQQNEIVSNPNKPLRSSSPFLLLLLLLLLCDEHSVGCAMQKKNALFRGAHRDKCRNAMPLLLVATALHNASIAITITNEWRNVCPYAL